MSEHFHCEICDKTIEQKSKRRHQKTRLYFIYDESVVNRYRSNIPDFTHTEEILKKHILNHNKRIRFYIVIYKWKLNFSNSIIIVSKDRWWSNTYYSKPKSFLLSKIKHYEKN